jgi:hypothetical protein
MRKLFLTILFLFAYTSSAYAIHFPGTLNPLGGTLNGPVTYSDLQANPATGSNCFGYGVSCTGLQLWCSDCTSTTPCAGSGVGAPAYGLNGQWSCTGGIMPGGGTISAWPFSFIGVPTASMIQAFACPFNVTIPANFVSPNTYATCGTNPSETDIYTVKVNGSTVGTLTLSTSCSLTRGSSSATTCMPGQRFEIDAPATVSGSNIGITIGITR